MADNQNIHVGCPMDNHNFKLSTQIWEQKLNYNFDLEVGWIHNFQDSCAPSTMFDSQKMIVKIWLGLSKTSLVVVTAHSQWVIVTVGWKICGCLSGQPSEQYGVSVLWFSCPGQTELSYFQPCIRY